MIAAQIHFVGPPLVGALSRLSRATRERTATSAGPTGKGLHQSAFTLVEVLAALLLMAIIIPVAMEGMSVASRAGVLGQRKAAAMRVAERVLNELVVEGQTQQTSSSGTIADGDMSYPWSMRTETWSEDAMLRMTVTVTFSVQGSPYDVSASTLIAPAGSAADTAAVTP